MKSENVGSGGTAVDWRAVLVFVSIAFSSQCGGGFASGSTPWTYFFRNTGFYGMLPEVTQSYFCLLMPLVVAAINYAQGFNDRVLNWYQKKSGEDPKVSEARRNRRGAVLTFVYICLTWVISQAGLTTLVSKGLTAASYINLFTLILPTVMNVIIGWPDREYDSGRKVQAGTK